MLFFQVRARIQSTFEPSNFLTGSCGLLLKGHMKNTGVPRRLFVRTLFQVQFERNRLNRSLFFFSEHFRKKNTFQVARITVNFSRQQNTAF